MRLTTTEMRCIIWMVAKIATLVRKSRNRRQTQMINKRKIKARAVELGKTLGLVATELGITQRSLSNKLSGRTQFTGLELSKLIKILSISKEEIPEYFFA